MQSYDQPQQQQIQSSNQPKKTIQNKKISPKIKVEFQIKEINLILYLKQTENQSLRDDTSKFISITIEMIEACFQQLSNSTFNAKLNILHLYANDLKQTDQNNQFAKFINKGFNVQQNSPLLIINLNNKTSNKTISNYLSKHNLFIQIFYFS